MRFGSTVLQMIAVLAHVRGYISADVAIAALFPLQGWYPAGHALLTAAQMGVEHVNQRSDILTGYSLTMEWHDTQCTPKIGTNALHTLLTTGAPKLMVLGPATSDVSEATAQVSYVFNVSQLSSVAVSPTLSNKDKYPWFFRTSGPEIKLNQARLSFLGAFGWKKVAILYQPIAFLMAANNELEAQLKLKNISILTSEEFISNSDHAIRNIKSTDARIVFTFLLEAAAVESLCQMYHYGLYGSDYIWIHVAWYEDHWWQTISVHNCTRQQMSLAVDGLFTIGAFYLNPLQERGLARMTSLEFMDEYLKRNGDVKPFGSKYAPQTYDSVWVIAKALNDSIGILNSKGFRLEQFTYDNNIMATVIRESLAAITMIGVKGFISFDSNGDPLGPVEIRRLTDGEFVYVGQYMDGNDFITWAKNITEIFQGVNVPRDSTLVQRQSVFVSMGMYVSMCSLAGCGIIVAFAFLVINVKWRRAKIIRMSAPNLNNVILVGCMISYLPIFFQDLSAQTTGIFCKIHIYSKAVGFSLTFGALFAKTWRIHVIFANKTAKSKVVKDVHLFAMIVGLLIVDLVLVLTWEFVDPLHVAYYTTGKEVLDVEEDILHMEEVCVCESDKMVYFFACLYVVYGLLLLFGVFLAWETRKVQIAELNDSRYIGMCIYNMLVPMVVGTALYHLLAYQLMSQYILVSLCQVVATSLTQCILFVPKINMLREQKIPAVGPASITQETESAAVAGHKDNMSSAAP